MFIIVHKFEQKKNLEKTFTGEITRQKISILILHHNEKNLTQIINE